MVATTRIAAVAHIIPSYSPGGANVHLHLKKGCLAGGPLGPGKSAALQRHFDLFRMTHCWANRLTTPHRLYCAMHAMPVKSVLANMQHDTCSLLDNIDS